ncbi:MAG TPA: hypothetical protein VNS58_00185 [Puia sp.]|nr:hypothetical protein [Puia sp.]
MPPMSPIFIIFLLYFAVVYLSCFLTGCLLVRKSWPLECKLLVLLSGLTLLVEMVVGLCVVRRIDNLWLYNFFTPVECGFIIYIYYRASVHPAIKRLNVLLLGLLPVSIGMAYWLHPVFNRFNEMAGLVYLFFELLAACSFLIDALLNKSDTPPGRQPLFWMACGVLIYSCIFTVISAVEDHKLKIPYSLYMLYSFVGNTSLYAGFIACFICLHRARRGPVVTSPYQIH